MPTNIMGDAGNNTLRPTGADQRLLGGAGNDRLEAGGFFRGTILIGGTGNDTYTVNPGLLDTAFVLENGNDPADRWVDQPINVPVNQIVEVDGRHLLLNDAFTGRSVLFIDWTRPENVIEFWDALLEGGVRRTFTFTEFRDAIRSSPAYAGSVSLDTLGSAYAAGVRAEIASHYAAAGTVGSMSGPSLVLKQSAGGLIAWDPARGADGFRPLLQLAPGTDPLAVADFTGDQKADILFAMPGGGHVVWDVSLAGTGFRTLPAFNGFQPVGTGDFRGSGATDILLLNAAGQLRVLDVAGNSGADLLTLNGQTRIAGVGNIDGGGRADIVFQNTASGALYALTDGGFRDLLTLDPGGGWTLAGIGNVRPGAAEDLVFRNTQTGGVVFWDATQGAAGFEWFATLGAEWSMRVDLDVNNDGRDDVLLTNAAGESVYWTGSGWVGLGSVLNQVQLAGMGPLG
ncbi:MAG TPA: hypothetical protein VED40_19535 [Azospirillaceae bacterium]|nr:hypothetical protein [Azospirillaceae bacterium]